MGKGRHKLMFLIITLQESANMLLFVFTIILNDVAIFIAKGLKGFGNTPYATGLS